MENKHVSSLRPGHPDLGPVLVVLLIAAHVIALIYGIFKLATEKQSQRRKTH